MSNFLDFAPKGPIKAAADRWDIFLSYRSVSRPWVLALYDVLRHLDYKVFMDQYVLTTSGSLEIQLSENLNLSATGILIWSHRSEDSKWCNDEYGALRSLEDSKPGFRYVVVNLDGADLPLFARQKLWIDFSAFREGPSGSNLLRLLCGLQGKPQPPDAVILASKMMMLCEKLLRAFSR